MQLFSDSDEGRLITDLRAALADQGADAGLAEVKELAANMPGVARAIVDMQRRLRETAERADLLAGRFTTPDGAASPAAFEAVRDWFYEWRNYVPELDEAAEAIGSALPQGRMTPGLIDRLAGRHGIRIATDPDGAALRRYDPATRILRLAEHLNAGQQAFQIATQLAFLEEGEVIDRLAVGAGATPDAQACCGSGWPITSRAP
ncbi:ImmA/IrrE family metallo-endopeptidase [Paracoccus denitrificans]|uniref:ImmA/IrrE family metallo-endopeptidase n=1 Tax=Paracoccus denitrificans TaxID=266 RepID=UPI001F15CEE7|nr:ImmA/IrrE family metallo-endopeptidase [Paracoccus denitrificans]